MGGCQPPTSCGTGVQKAAGETSDDSSLLCGSQYHIFYFKMTSRQCQPKKDWQVVSQSARGTETEDTPRGDNIALSSNA